MHIVVLICDLRSVKIDGSVHHHNLDWQPLTQRRKNTRLHLFHKGIRGLAAVPVNTFRHLMVIPLLCPHMWIPIST